ncbi:MAG: nucleotidyltransferase family protein [Desulfomonile tiedjei]|nr:nucleotidyltransferase family protein [Desulfomonile tiedjei]
MNVNDLIQEKREDILQLAGRYGAANVRIFGSVARGQAGPESDTDFLVDMEPGRTLFDLGGLLYELSEPLGIPVDVVPEKGLRDHVRSNVMKEAVPL